MLPLLLHDLRCQFTATAHLGVVTVEEEDGRIWEEEKKKLPAWRSLSTLSSRPLFFARMQSLCYMKKDFWARVSSEMFYVSDILTGDDVWLGKSS